MQDQGTSNESIRALFGRVRHFVPRQVLFRQGDAAASAYFLLSGSVDIRFRDADLAFKSSVTLNAGQFFGELGLLQNAPRSGTAVVTSWPLPVTPSYMRKFQPTPEYPDTPE